MRPMLDIENDQLLYVMHIYWKYTIKIRMDWSMKIDQQRVVLTLKVKAI